MCFTSITNHYYYNVLHCVLHRYNNYITITSYIVYCTSITHNDYECYKYKGYVITLFTVGYPRE